MDAQIDELVVRLDGLDELEKKIRETANEIALIKDTIDRLADPATDLSEVRGKSAPLAENRAKITGLIAGLQKEGIAAERVLENAEARVGTNCRECGKEIRREDLAGVIEASQEKVEGLR